MVMFLSALQPYAVIIIIAVVLLQYAFAVFCLLKLAYMDLTKDRYILWNLFILIVFFIGGAVFLVYYKKHPELRIPKDAAVPQQDNKADTEAPQNVDENAINSTDGAAQTSTDGYTENEQEAQKEDAQEQTDNQ